MFYTQHIGSFFKSSVTVELLPFGDLDPNHYHQVTIVINDGNIYQHNSFHVMGTPSIRVGADIHSIQYEIVSRSSSSYIAYQGNIRLDRLILLNLAKKLLK